MPIADLTLMRVPPWRKRMENAPPGAKSFRTLFPDDYLRILAGIEYGVPVD